MVGDWEIRTLAEAGITLIDCVHKTPPASQTGYPYVAIPQLCNGQIDLPAARRITREDFIDWTRKAKPVGDDVVLSRRCNPGETAHVPSGIEFALGQNLVLLRSDGTKVYPPFLRWLARGPDWWEQVRKFLNVGAVFNSLKCKDVPKFELRIPPLDDQRAIAHILGTLDDKIELNRRMNETLEAIARAIFKSWFVDFDPVRAKAGGEPPDSICRRLGLAPDLLALFPDRLVDSEIGEIPEGWEAKPFGEWLTHTIGGDWGADQPDEQHPVKVRIVRGTDIPKLRNGIVDGVPCRYTKERRLATRKVQPEDLILEVSGGSKGQPTGRALRVTQFIVDALGDTVVPASFCRLLRPISADMGPLLAIHLDMSYEAGKTWEYQNQSTGISNFQTKFFLAHELVLNPGKELRVAFSRQVVPLLSGQCLSEAGALAALRDALLPKLLSGELRVPDAEKAAKALA